jgi:arylsulfatase A-like enzyme
MSWSWAKRWVAPTLLATALFAMGGCSRERQQGPDLPVILVTVDTLRADHLGVYGYPRPTSPELDRWAEQAAVFEQAIATSPWTLASFGSLFTGFLPERHGAGYRFGKRRFSRLDGEVTTLAETLDRAGYVTGAVVTNIYLTPKFGMARGFETFVNLAGGKEAPPGTADMAVDRALVFVHQHQDEPFFLFLHLIEPHLPYDAPAPVRGRFTADSASHLQLPFDQRRGVRSGGLKLEEADRAFVAAAYDEEIAFADLHLGRLFDGLVDLGLLDSSLVVFTSDHGEELFDHGGFEHGHTLYQELLRIPLMVRGPDVQAGRYREPVSLVDIQPTILEAIGLAAAAEAEGRSFQGLITGQQDLPSAQLAAQWNVSGPQRQTLIEWPHKLVLNLGTGESLLFDLARDPREQSPLGASEAETARRLKRDLRSKLSRREPPAESAAVLNQEEIERLRALGYVD